VTVFIQKIASLGTEVVHADHLSSYVCCIVSYRTHFASVEKPKLLVWIHPVLHKDQCRAFVKSVMKLRVP
jgi:hypothetical protein